MKRKSLWIIICVLALATVFAGCSKDKEKEEEKDNIPPVTTPDDTTKVNLGEEFTSKDEDFTVSLMADMKKVDEEKTDEVEGTNTNFSRGEGTILTISELIMPGETLSEETIKTEIGLDDYFVIERVENIKVEGLGTYYGAIVFDKAMGQNMMYYRIQNGDKIVSFILYQEDKFTAEEEAELKAMISTLKFK